MGHLPVDYLTLLVIALALVLINKTFTYIFMYLLSKQVCSVWTVMRSTLVYRLFYVWVGREVKCLSYIMHFNLVFLSLYLGI